MSAETRRRPFRPAAAAIGLAGLSGLSGMVGFVGLVALGGGPAAAQSRARRSAPVRTRSSGRSPTTGGPRRPGCQLPTARPWMPCRSARPVCATGRSPPISAGSFGPRTQGATSVRSNGEQPALNLPEVQPEGRPAVQPAVQPEGQMARDSASARLARYQSRVICRPSAKVVRAVKSNSFSARLASTPRRGWPSGLDVSQRTSPS